MALNPTERLLRDGRCTLCGAVICCNPPPNRHKTPCREFCRHYDTRSAAYLALAEALTGD